MFLSRRSPFALGLLVLGSLAPGLALAQSPFLVKDTNPTLNSPPYPGFGPLYGQAIRNGYLYFSRSDSLGGGEELWKTDGTNSGTVRVRDINYGASGSLAHDLMEVNGMVYFIATDGVTGYELWKSDGTTEGTVLVKDIRPGVATVAVHLANANGVLFFAVFDGVTTELWKSDGTTAGTVFVKVIDPGLAYNDPTRFTAIGGTIYFSASSGGADYELWKSDGTAAGTVLVKNINAAGPSNPSQLANVNGTLYFTANDGTTGTELWKSDGTAVGTVLVKDIQPGIAGSSIASLTTMGTTLFLTASDGTTGMELWKSDGTAVGTALVKDLAAGALSANPASLLALGGTLYFQASDGATGAELWKSDGTGPGTTLVKDIAAGGASSNATPIGSMNGVLYLAADDGLVGSELWASDGTAAGTTLVKDIVPGSTPSYPYATIIMDGFLYLWASNGSSGAYHDDLWRTDGTTAGTVQVNTTTAGSLPLFLANLDGTLYFRADDGTAGAELWRSDGTIAGTALVKDISVGGSSFPAELTVVNGTLLFSASTGLLGRELWKSDGTSAGTVIVKDIASGSAGSTPAKLTPMGGSLYFVASDLVTGRELWKSDGTEAGTTLVRDIAPGSATSDPRDLTNVNGTLYFTADDGTAGRELWKSDGTAAGTVLVKDIISGAGSLTALHLTNMNGVLYFTADGGGGQGQELWRSNGTAAGTFVVKDINPGGGSSSPDALTTVGTTLFFRANDGTTGTELWKSDGTAAGTVRVKDILVGANSSNPGGLTNVSGTLFFNADDGVTGNELWKSDGTGVGTVLVKDLLPGILPSNSFDLFNANGTLYLWASDGLGGFELWRSNGTAAGTVLVGDISPRASPAEVALACPYMFFTATTSRVGQEVFAVPLLGATAGAAYADADGDGYGSGPASAAVCPGTPGYAANNTDCNDDDSTIHPGAPDLTCNGIDNNCSHTIDEGVACVCTEHAPGLVGWWPANVNVDDATGNTFTYVVPTMQHVPAKVGNGLLLDGTNYAEADDSPVLEMDHQLTLEVWIKPSTLPLILAEVMSKFGYSGSWAYELGVRHDGTLEGKVSGTGTTYDNIGTASGAVAAGLWTHIAMTFDTGFLKLYVNGALAASKASTVTAIFSGGTMPLSIGREATQTEELFVGLIDEAAIYNRALSAAEIQAIYDAGSSGMCGTGCAQNVSGLTGWWPGEGTAGDRSSFHHDGVATNGSSFAAGKVGSAFSFDGVNDYVANLGDATTFSFIENTGVFTIDAWVNLTDIMAHTQQAITANTGTSIEKGHFFVWENSAGEQKLRLGLMQGIDGVPVIESSSQNQVITTPGWHHVAAVGNGTGVLYYVDGVQYPGTGTMGAKPSGNSTRAVDIGRCPYPTPECQFKGLIDEVQIFNRALSTREIRSIYEAGSSGMCGLGLVTAVEEEPEAAPPLSFALAQPWPNPADRTASVFFRTPSEGPVRADVFDVAGRRVATLIDSESLPAGEHRVAWNCRDRTGRRAAAGVYFVRVTAGKVSAVKKITLIRR